MSSYLNELGKAGIKLINLPQFSNEYPILLVKDITDKFNKTLKSDFKSVLGIMESYKNMDIAKEFVKDNHKFYNKVKMNFDEIRGIIMSRDGINYLGFYSVERFIGIELIPSIWKE